MRQAVGSYSNVRHHRDADLIHTPLALPVCLCSCGEAVNDYGARDRVVAGLCREVLGARRDWSTTTGNNNLFVHELRVSYSAHPVALACVSPFFIP